MSTRKRIAIIGYGNVGRHCVEAVQTSPDFELAGVVRRAATDPLDVPVATDVKDLGRVDGALLACPTRLVPATASTLLSQGIATCDSFDIHGEPLVELRRTLDGVAREHGVAAVISAGWDPGSDSMLRALFEAMAPRGLTTTNFGPGMSMGHTVAVKAIEGVQKALSMTLPAGYGVHKRAVYVELAPNADALAVERAIKADPYFVKDETRVTFVEDVDSLVDTGHGVVIERRGASGRTSNQSFRFEMRIQNPALTAQLMLGGLRAALRQRPGCYTMLEVPLVDLLPGEREGWVRKLV